jgi:hypothetical protein
MSGPAFQGRLAGIVFSPIGPSSIAYNAAEVRIRPLVLPDTEDFRAQGQDRLLRHSLLTFQCFGDIFESTQM